MTGPAEELRRILNRIPREEPPEIPLNRLFDQIAEIRRRTVVAIGGLLAAGFLVALTVGDRPVDPPVHLNIQVVTETPVAAASGAAVFGAAVSGAAEFGADGVAPDSPAEFDRP